MAETALALAIIGASMIAPRYDCDLMRDTPYRETVMEIERDWFLSHCVITSSDRPTYTDDSMRGLFTLGFLDGGGNANDLPLVYCLVELESHWHLDSYNPEGPYYGLGQWLLSTWESVGGGDLYDPYIQGRNFARNWKPASQWPRAYEICNG